MASKGYYDYSGKFVPLSADYRSTIWGDYSKTITGGADPVRLYSAAGGNVMVAGSGDVTFNHGSLNNVMSGGSGVDTVVAMVNVVLKDGDNIENIITDGTYGSLIATGSSGANIIVADRPGHTLTGMGGDDVYVAAGDTKIILAQGSGKDIIYNFHTGAGGDVVRLSDFGFTSLAQVKAAMTQQGADVILRLSDTDAVKFAGTSIAAFTKENFDLQLDRSGFRLTFQDEFNSLSISDGQSLTGTWNTSFGYGTPGDVTSRTGLHEINIYTDAAFKGTSQTALGINPFSVSDGVLTITAKPTTTAQQDALWGYKYASGLLTTESTFAQKYGYFEARIDTPEAKGFWPVFWMLSKDRAVELDIVEKVNNYDGMAYHSAHWYDDTGKYVQQSEASYTPLLEAGFHTYGVLWTAETIKYYIDGALVSEQRTPDDMHEAMYMLVNLQVGGWAGDPGGATAQLKVDYVRAYAIDGITEAAKPTDISSATSYQLAPNEVNLTLTGANAINGTGNALDNTITGNSAANLIDGGAGADRMIGGLGDDTYVVDDWNDVVVEDANAGLDTVRSSIDFKLGAGLENLVLTGSASLGVGNASANVITGNGADNQLYGYEGADTLNGGAGNDYLDGGEGNDRLLGGAGNDTYYIGNAGDTVVELSNEGVDTVLSWVDFRLDANVENLTFIDFADGNLKGTGNELGNVLTGNNQANVLDGGKGADTIIGGGGADTLIGGAGNDRFVFAAGSGADVIQDFARGDIIKLSADLGRPTITYVSDGAHIQLSATDSIHLLGVTRGTLTAYSDGYTFTL